MQIKQPFYGQYLYFMQTDVLPPTLKAMRSNRTGRTKMNDPTQFEQVDET